MVKQPQLSVTAQESIRRAKLIKNEIPVLLAKLALKGKEEIALDLLISWGTQQKDNETVWHEANSVMTE